MINLEKLEKILDEALANQTKESWNNWHESHVLAGWKEYVGDSIIDCLPVEYGTSGFMPRNENIYAPYGRKYISACENNYVQAA